MTDIRKYINLVEDWGQRGTTTRAFGRRGLVDAADRPFIPTDPKEHAALERAQEYSSAEEYADENNPFGPSYNTDPVHLQQKVENEHRRLVAQWNHWKASGLIR